MNQDEHEIAVESTASTLFSLHDFDVDDVIIVNRRGFFFVAIIIFSKCYWNFRFSASDFSENTFIIIVKISIAGRLGLHFRCQFLCVLFVETCA